MMKRVTLFLGLLGNLTSCTGRAAAVKVTDINYARCLCVSEAIHSTRSDEEKRVLEGEIKSLFNQSYFDRVADKCKVFVKTQNFEASAALLDYTTDGKVTKCMVKYGAPITPTENQSTT